MNKCLIKTAVVARTPILHAAHWSTPGHKTSTGQSLFAQSINTILNAQTSNYRPVDGIKCQTAEMNISISFSAFFSFCIKRSKAMV